MDHQHSELAEKNEEAANRQTASLAGFAVTLFLLIFGLFLVRESVYQGCNRGLPDGWPHQLRQAGAERPRHETGLSSRRPHTREPNSSPPIGNRVRPAAEESHIRPQQQTTMVQHKARLYSPDSSLRRRSISTL